MNTQQHRSFVDDSASKTIKFRSIMLGRPESASHIRIIYTQRLERHRTMRTYWTPITWFIVAHIGDCSVFFAFYLFFFLRFCLFRFILFPFNEKHHVLMIEIPICALFASKFYLHMLLATRHTNSLWMPIYIVYAMCKQLLWCDERVRRARRCQKGKQN